MQAMTIGFIGGGNMAGAIIRGLAGQGIAPGRIAVSDPSAARREALAGIAGGLLVSASNEAVAEAADVLVIAVKPQVMGQALPPLATLAQQNRPLVVSIAAGIPSTRIDEMLGGGLAVVRAMPNQPALLGEGMTVMTANAAARLQRATAEEILSATGEVLWVDDEAMIDAATAISGSGPAYFYLLMEALDDAAREFGFSSDAARLLVNQTARGAAAVAAAADEDLAVLRERVTSPGGTTAAALAALEAGDIRAIFSRAFKAARERAVELAGDTAS